MVRLDGKVCITEKMMDAVVQLRNSYDESDIEMHRSFKEVMTGRTSSIRSMDQIADPLMKVMRLVENTENENLTQIIIGDRVKASGLKSDTIVILFTENMFLAAWYKATMPDRTVYQVGLESGKIWLVPLSIHSPCKLLYMINNLYSIRTHVALVRGRGRFSLANKDAMKPRYFIDTEFCPRIHNKSGSIYDVALINGFDPYSSICSYLRIDQSAYVKLQELRRVRGEPPLNIPYSEFTTAPTARTFYNKVCSLVGDLDPIIYYFSTKHDISVFYEFDPIYDEARQSGSIEKEHWEFKQGYNYDFEFEDGRPSGNSKGTMSELYEQATGSKVDQFKHILLHTACPDALLLWEYVMSRSVQ
jgi:hypothetical protein